jgi:hypothetical protein
VTTRGWGLVRAVTLALVVAVCSPVDPLVLVFVPLAVQLFAFRWDSRGGLLLATVSLVVAFAGLARGTGDSLWYVERAWSLLLGGAFVGVTLLWPGRGVVSRGLAATVAVFALLGLASLVHPSLFSDLDWRISSDLTDKTGVVALWMQGRSGSAAKAFESAMYRAVGWEVRLYPGSLALASLAALGVGAYVTSRLRGRSDALGPVREFRFNDHLVWVLVAGIVLFLLPLGDVAARLGENALLVMGGLYLLRGAGILLWLGAALVSSAWSALLWGVIAVLMYPVGIMIALLLGLGDTWLDLRGRLGVPPGPERG